MSHKSTSIRLVIFDWAGTTIDFGSLAPVAAFMAAFARHGVEVTAEEARGPMGLHKKDHIRQMLRLPGVQARWQEKHEQDPTETDVERLFQMFVPMQLEVLPKHSDLIPGVLETVKELRAHDIRIAGTTGYFREAAERVRVAAEKQGYAPDFNLCPEDVPSGRPAPWMIYRSMEKFGIYPSSAVLKVGDTVPDIEEGKNAGVWSYGVSHTSCEVGLTKTEFYKLSDEARNEKIAKAEQKLLTAGAHGVLSTIAEVPKLIDELNARLAKGERS